MGLDFKHFSTEWFLDIRHKGSEPYWQGEKLTSKEIWRNTHPGGHEVKLQERF